MNTIHHNQAQKVNVLSAGQYYHLSTSTIVGIQSTGHSESIIRTVDGRSYAVGKSLSRLQNQLPQFWRLHKGYLVNPDFVKGSVGSVKYQGLLQLTTGGSLPVPDSRKEQVYALLRLQEAARPEARTLSFVAANFALRCSR